MSEAEAWLGPRSAVPPYDAACRPDPRRSGQTYESDEGATDEWPLNERREAHNPGEVAKRPRELLPHPNPLFVRFTACRVWLAPRRASHQLLERRAINQQCCVCQLLRARQLVGVGVFSCVLQLHRAQHVAHPLLQHDDVLAAVGGEHHLMRRGR
jgi:hypothetical protein